MDARLILDPPAPGAWNMAVDEALLLGLRDSRKSVLRFYQWSEPTLSLGYFQRCTHRDAHPPSCHLPMVRRSTGGGAIVHDHELTYCLIVPMPDNRPSAARKLVATVHDCLVEMLVDLNLSAQRVGSASKPQPERPPSNMTDEAFLCFERRADDDVVVGQNKVLGSAQRRYRGGLLQHGSLILRRSQAAPELPGMLDLKPNASAEGSAFLPGADRQFAEQFSLRWSVQLGLALSLDWTRSTLSESERQAARCIEQERFAAKKWNQKR